MRFLIVYPYIAYPETAFEFMEKLAMCGNEIVALSASCQKELSKSNVFNSKNIKLYEVPCINLRPKIFESIIQRYPYFLHLSDLVDRMSPDLIVIMSPLFLSSAQAIKEAIKNKKPCVLEIHGVYSERGFLLHTIQNMYFNTIGKWILSNSTLIRCLQKDDAFELLKLGASLEKIRIVPNAVDTNLFKPSEEREENSLIWIGRMVPEKGLKYLIKALHIVIKEHYLKNISLKLIGDGPQSSSLLKMVRRFDLKKHVRFLGSRSRKEVANILARSSLFVFPSVREGMPFSVLEAMSCGLPVIASRVIGLRNLVVDGYNGLTVPPGDPKSLADTIALLITDSTFKERLSKNAREYVLKKHSYDQILPKLLRMYHEVITLT